MKSSKQATTYNRLCLITATATATATTITAILREIEISSTNPAATVKNMKVTKQKVK